MGTILSFMNPQSLLVKLGIAAVLAAVVFFSGWTVESWRWSASNTQIEAKYAAAEKANAARQLAASNAAMIQLNDLEERLTNANQAEKAFKSGGACFDADRVRVLNSIIGGH